MKHLNEAKKAKFDEYYTQYIDVQNEMTLYIDKFKNKTIYMNCDDPSFSNFWKYFYNNFRELQLKQIISTYYNPCGKSYKTTYDGVKETKTPLQGNGDFRSDECIEILKEADLIITNPPFSIWSQFFNILIDNKKQFLILGTILKAGQSNTLIELKHSRIWLGANEVNEFVVPDDYDKHHVTRDGKKYKKVACYWYTNIKKQKRKQLFKDRTTEYYDKYRRVVNIDRIEDITLEHKYLGVPVTIFQYEYEDYFEVLGKIKATVNNTNKFQRIVLKRKNFIN